MKSETRKYRHTRFPSEVIKKAVLIFDTQINPAGALTPSLYMMAVVEGAQRGHDNEDEFFADYRKQSDEITYSRSYYNLAKLIIHSYPSSSVSVEVEASQWPQVLAVMEVFEENKQQSLLPELSNTETDDLDDEEPVIFIGHGPTNVWNELRDHLRDKHNFKLEAYEIGARAGHTIRDILESMLSTSSMAFLVMTGDDVTVTGEVHPRLNVVHEAGLFQGRLGFHRAIILLENGVTEFSNIHGVEQIRFTNIREVFGDVVATIRREFPNS
ncbi:MAG: TIR domain-containing protein [Chthoniobacterales bacterium]